MVAPWNAAVQAQQPTERKKHLINTVDSYWGGGGGGNGRAASTKHKYI